MVPEQCEQSVPFSIASVHKDNLHCNLCVFHRNFNVYESVPRQREPDPFEGIRLLSNRFREAGAAQNTSVSSQIAISAW